MCDGWEGGPNARRRGAPFAAVRGLRTRMVGQSGRTGTMRLQRNGDWPAGAFAATASIAAHGMAPSKYRWQARKRAAAHFDVWGEDRRARGGSFTWSTARRRALARVPHLVRAGRCVLPMASSDIWPARRGSAARFALRIVLWPVPGTTPSVLSALGRALPAPFLESEMPSRVPGAPPRPV